jgi:hypothetical protein
VALNYADQSDLIDVLKSHHEGRLIGKGTIGKKAITPDPNLYEICSICENMDIYVKIRLSSDICVKYAKYVKVLSFV